ncbi:MAG: efflux RND transporter periplasmic adaptor subunit [Candidatus Puniceispirillales bacterium]
MIFRSSYFWAFTIFVLVLGWMFSDDLFNNFINQNSDNNDNSKIETSTAINSNETSNELIILAKKVKNKFVQKTIRSNSVTYPEFEISIPSEVQGKIKKIFVKEGDFISKGSKILEIDRGTLNQKISAAKASLKAAEKSLDISNRTSKGTLDIELQAAKADLKLAKQNLTIVEKLFKQNYASSLEVTQKLSQVENVQVRIAQLENKQNFNSELNVIKSEAEYENAKSILMELEEQSGNMIISSPSNGILEKLYLDEGERVSKNSTVAEILGMENIKLIAKISQAEVGQIKIKDDVKINFNNNIFNGKVSKISSNANSSTRTFDVEIITKNIDFLIKGGMTAEIEIITDEIEAFQISPAHLSVNNDGTLNAKVVENGKVQFKKVSIIKSDEDVVNVLGLNDNDIILTKGQAFVQQGDNVQYKLED